MRAQKIPEDAGDFRLLSPRAAAALRQLPERNRFFKGLATWIGFKQIRVDYEPAERAHGRTSWNLYSLIGLSIEGLTSFSVAPLRLASLLGLLLAGGAFIFGMQILFETVIYGKSVPGYPSVVVGLMVLGGVQLIMIGIVGEYIGKILSEIKARPVYFVAEHTRQDRGRYRRGETIRRSARRPSKAGHSRHRMNAHQPSGLRHIWLCADDYGISAGVNTAIRDLIVRGRLNATSVMVAAPSFNRFEAVPLNVLNCDGAARGDRAALYAHGAVPPAEPGLRAAARRRIPAARRYADRGRAPSLQSGHAGGRGRAPSWRPFARPSAARPISSTGISTFISSRR